MAALRVCSNEEDISGVGTLSVASKEGVGETRSMIALSSASAPLGVLTAKSDRLKPCDGDGGDGISSSEVKSTCGMSHTGGDGK